MHSKPEYFLTVFLLGEGSNSGGGAAASQRRRRRRPAGGLAQVTTNAGVHVLACKTVHDGTKHLIPQVHIKFLPYSIVSVGLFTREEPPQERGVQSQAAI